MPDTQTDQTTLKGRVISNLLILLAVLMAIFLIGMLAASFYKAETNLLRLNFEETIDDKVEILESEIFLNLELLHTMKGLFDISREVSYEGFNLASHNILNRNNSITGMSWEPYILGTERQAFEERYQTLFPDYKITHREASGAMTLSPVKDDYTPVLFIEPWEGNQNAHGFDLSSHPQRLITLEKARDTGDIIASDSLVLVQDPPDVKSFLAIFAIYNDKISDLQSRRRHLRGYISGVFRINKLIEKSIQTSDSDNVQIRLLDISHQNIQTLFESGPKEGTRFKEAFLYKKELKEFAGRRWLIEAVPKNQFIEQKRGFLPYILFALGSLFILVSGAYSSVLLNKTKELDKAKKIVEKISLVDGLTGISNRRHFDQFLEKEWARSIRDNLPISLMMLDIDYFKRFNDDFGHLAGDECLKRVAKALQRVISRRFDLLARFGGEEFVIVLHNTDQVMSIAETCREAVENCKINHPSSEVSKFITISIGACTMNPTLGADLNDLIEHADQALYEAKDKGRNRVVKFQPPIQ